MVSELVLHAGGTDRTISEGVSRALGYIDVLAQQTRSPCPTDQLMLGVMNGSSDPTSGLFSNWAAGKVSDWLMGLGGRVAFSQTVEVLGTEKTILSRCIGEIRAEVSDLLTAVADLHWVSEQEGGQGEPTEGNLTSGISTLAEKSRGTIQKFGHAHDNRIVELVRWGHRALGGERGICLVDGPGQDILCLTGLVAAGCQLVLFTTGNGTPTSSPIAPTIKITANGLTGQAMSDDIDIGIPVGDFVEGRRGMTSLVEEEVLPQLLAFANGKRTCGESRGQSDFQLRQMWPTE